MAKAFGDIVGATYNFGIGFASFLANSCTIEYIAGCCCAVTEYAFIDRNANEALFQ